MTGAEYVVRDAPERSRYEVVGDGEVVVGYLEYTVEPGLIVLAHTEVAPSVEGQGVGSRLVKGALEDIRSRALRIIPLCPFVKAYLQRHPEQRDVVAARD